MRTVLTCLRDNSGSFKNNQEGDYIHEIKYLRSLTVPKINQQATHYKKPKSSLISGKLGYTRIWYAEHHGSDAFASATPEILVAHIASATEKFVLARVAS